MEERKEAVLDKLVRARRELLETAGTLNEEQWERKVFSEEEEWRVSDLFRHVVSSEQSMTRLIETIRDGGEGVPADFDLVRWNARGVQKTKEKTTPELSADLTTNRTHLLGVIDSLGEGDWDKQGRHGSMRMMTIEEILHLIADHEIRHLADIKKAVG
jgi:hypothetical protein